MVDRKLEFTFGISSLLGMLLSVVVTVVGIIHNDDGPESTIIILSLASINVALAVICARTVIRNDQISQEQQVFRPKLEALEESIKKAECDLKESARQRGDIADIIHSIQDQLRDRVFELFTAYTSILENENGEEIRETELIEYSRLNEMFYLFLIDNVKAMFDLITGDKCSVCIKILDDEDSTQNIMVKTFIRDSGSYRERKVSDGFMTKYPYYDNAAFKTILSSDPRSYFVSDNLSCEPGYFNSNPDWKKFYNATLVCPIRIEIGIEACKEQEYSVLGFICVDNHKGNLKSKECLHLLASIADSIYNHFLLYNEFRSAALAQTSQD